MPDRQQPFSPERSPEHRHLGDAVRELRGRHGLSQPELAAEAGLDQLQLAEIERGEVDPSFVTLVKVAHGVPSPLGDLMRMFERRRAGAA